MKVGFTGTREGMTVVQWEQFEHLVTQLEDLTEFHDGDCLGADTQAHATVRHLGYRPEMHGHPCNLYKYRSHNEYDVTYPVKAPLVRNRDIVRNVDLMFAAPKEFEEVMRGSGTWATIRYAKQAKVPLIVVFPDGTEERFNYEGTSPHSLF